MNLVQEPKIDALSSIDKTELRLVLSSFYLEGNGLEIGALHFPLALSSKAKVKYVDRLPVDELRRHYPELRDLDLVDVDIIDDGEQLTTVANNSVDFVIANHMLEHCKNPIQTIQVFLSKVRPGGIVYIGIPDKRYSFDRDRDLTSFEHLTEDYYQRGDHFPHYREWAKYVNELKTEEEIEQRAHLLNEMQYSIHFHVWDYQSFVNFLLRTNEFLDHSFDILNISFNDHLKEVITLLRKK